MDWLKEFSQEELLEHLDGDTQIIYESCGLATLEKLWDGNLMGMSLHISTRPLFALKKAYIMRHYNGKNTKELALTLRLSERTIFRYAHRLAKEKKGRK